MEMPKLKTPHFTFPSKHFNHHRIIFSSPTLSRSLSSQKPDFKVDTVRNIKFVVDHVKLNQN